MRRRPAAASCCRPRPRRSCADTPGPATSASSRTRSSARWFSRAARRSRPRTCCSNSHALPTCTSRTVRCRSVSMRPLRRASVRPSRRPVRGGACATALLVTLVATGGAAHAQDLEPRAYTNTPVGMNFVVAGYGYTTGGLSTDPALPITDAHLEVHTAVLAYARSIDVFGTSGKVDVVLPYAFLSGSALYMGQPRTRDISGFADPRFRLSVNLYGAPALSLEDFQA